MEVFIEHPFLRYASKYWAEHAKEHYSQREEIRVAVSALVLNPRNINSSIAASMLQDTWPCIFWWESNECSGLLICIEHGWDDLVIEFPQ